MHLPSHLRKKVEEELRRKKVTFFAGKENLLDQILRD